MDFWLSLQSAAFSLVCGLAKVRGNDVERGRERMIVDLADRIAHRSRDIADGQDTGRRSEVSMKAMWEERCNQKAASSAATSR